MNYKLAPGDEAKVLAILREGLRVRDVARRLGIGRQWVSKLAKRAGTKGRK